MIFYLVGYPGRLASCFESGFHGPKLTISRETPDREWRSTIFLQEGTEAKVINKVLTSWPVHFWKAARRKVWEVCIPLLSSREPQMVEIMVRGEVSCIKHGNRPWKNSHIMPVDHPSVKFFRRPGRGLGTDHFTTLSSAKPHRRMRQDYGTRLLSCRGPRVVDLVVWAEIP